MAKSYRDALEASRDVWIASSGDIDLEDTETASAMTRRMLMAQWLSAAWTDLTTNHSQMFTSAFVKTGFLIAKDGSEDHLIDIQGWCGAKPYSYRESE